MVQLNTKQKLALCGAAVFALHSLTFAAPATQPIVTYDRFADVTDVVVDLGAVAFGYRFDGPIQKDVHDSIVVAWDRSKFREDGQIIFLVNGKDRFPVKFNDGKAVVGADRLKALSDAATLEFAVISNQRIEVTLTMEQIQQLRGLLDRTRYFSASAVQERRKSAETQAKVAAEAEVAKKRMEEAAARTVAESQRVKELEARKVREETKKRKDFFAPDGGVIYIFDTSGSMISRLKEAKALAADALDLFEPRQPFNMCAFNENVTSLWMVPQPVNSDSRKEILRFTDHLSTQQSPGPAVGEAFRGAVKMKPSTIVLFTDGGMSDVDRSQVREALRGSGSALHVALIGEVERADEARGLTQLVDESKGVLMKFPR